MIPVPIALNLDRHAARHRSWHPVGRQPSSGEFGHTNSHALAAEVIWHPSYGGGDHFGVLVGIGTRFVLTAVDFAAQRCPLHEDIFETEAKPLTTFRIGWLG